MSSFKKKYFKNEYSARFQQMASKTVCCVHGRNKASHIPGCFEEALQSDFKNWGGVLT